MGDCLGSVGNFRPWPDIVSIADADDIARISCTAFGLLNPENEREVLAT